MVVLEGAYGKGLRQIEMALVSSLVSLKPGH